MQAESVSKKIISTTNEKSTDVALLLIRVGTALFMLFGHGIPKISVLQQSPVKFINFMGLSPETSLVLAIFAEIGCSILVLIGLGTRLAVVPLITTMAIAAFVYHGANPFAMKEVALLYLIVFTALFLQGSGKYSVDHLLMKRK